ncbi:VWA domain-containing protein [Flavobacteriaceae bacterium D16]|nr:VWA domain-containing protein [Flavobacteriaceae bacterium D16]
MVIERLANINWEEFHFLRPQFLWLMLPLILILVLGLIGIRDQVKWKKHIAPHLRPYVISKGSEVFKRWMQILTFLVLTLAIVGLSGPSWEKIDLPDQILETPLVIALDLSQSMMAEDLQPNRLERAKFKIADLLDKDPKVRIALLGFSGTAHTLVPLTKDYTIIESYLKSINTGVLPFPGTDLEAALKLADSLGSATKAPGTLLLVTDTFDELTFTQLQDFVMDGKTKVVILPVGTAAGAQVPLPRSSRPMVNAQGKPVISALDEQMIQKIGAIDNISICKMTLDDSDMELLATTLRKELEFREKEEETKENWKDEGLIFIIPFAFFMLFWFRRGWVLYSLGLVFFLGSCSPNSEFSELWLTTEYRAQQKYDQGKFEEAAMLFTDPLRKGTAYYQAGDYSKAIEALARDSTSRGQYNLGLAYFKAGELAMAQIAFEHAALLDPEWQAASVNLERTTSYLGKNQDVFFEAEEVPTETQAQNIENTSPEDLGGGGQEATEEDMAVERLEETVETDIRTGKELEEVPEDLSAGSEDLSQNVLMRKVDDDPSLFLKRKFAHQVKTKNMKPKKDLKKW